MSIFFIQGNLPIKNCPDFYGYQLSLKYNWSFYENRKWKKNKKDWWFLIDNLIKTIDERIHRMNYVWKNWQMDFFCEIIYRIFCLKFIYSEKVTKYEIFTLLLSVCTVSKGKISQNFVAFSEYMNFRKCEL